MTKKYVVAVSGGIDSVVLLDMLVKRGEQALIVAHFDHGIRSDSADDARFVEGLAARYDLPFITRREELGKQASEEVARERRYAFLRTVCTQHGGIIVTAHHADDVVETIAINLSRGTGWRGLAVLETKGIYRPLLDKTKQEIRDYALTQKLEWVEDSTNATDTYLRNRLRADIARQLPAAQKNEIRHLWRRQLELKRLIDDETATYLSHNEYSRYFMTHIDDQAAIELLRAIVVNRTQCSLPRPQLARALLAIKTARAGAISEIGGKIRLRFTASTFIVETP